MSTEIIVAIIALSGAVISVVVSAFMSMRQTKTEVMKSMRQTETELIKIRSEINQTYVNKLIEKRLDVYPQFYFLLSDFIKRFKQHDTASLEMLKDFRAKIEEWDSKNSLLFSDPTTDICHNFLMELIRLTEMTEDDLQKYFQIRDNRRNLRKFIEKLELALKYDLGIHSVEFSEDRKFSSYKEAVEAVTKKLAHQERQDNIKTKG